jgi:YbbR domain-containing protein
MKKKLTNNIGLKILSVFLAALLWLVIMNVDDPVKSRTFSNVPVSILNENVIKVPDKVYEIMEGESVSFRVLGKRSIVDKLTSYDFNVTADFSKLLSGGNSVLIDISSKKEDLTITDLSPKAISLRQEEISMEDFKVNVVVKGEVTEGYYVGEKTTSPLIVRVDGPKGRIDKIKEVVVEVDVTGASQSMNRLAIPKALDEDGHVIDSSKLNFSEDYIQVNLKLYKTKTVELKAKVEGKPADGYVVVDVEHEPKTVVIASEDDAILDKINSLTIIENIDGVDSTLERDIDLKERLELPKGVILVGDNQTVGMNIIIERLETKEITIWPNDIGLRNRKEFQEVGFYTTGPIKIKVKGPADEIDELDRFTLKPYIDLIDCSVGTYGLEIEADLPEHTTIIDTPLVSISIVSS